MRVEVGKALTVAHGDEVTLTAKLMRSADLARLFVFAREEGNDCFIPFIPGLNDKLNAIGSSEPMLLTPLQMRLTDQHRTKTLKFTADIDGEIQVMQEIDVATDVRAQVRLKSSPGYVKNWMRRWLKNSKSLSIP